jgi:hypothetical protein
MTEAYKQKLSYLDNPILSLEIIDFLCGDLLGQGCFRDVYEYPLDPNWVIKIEREDGCGENWSEYRIWGAVMETEHKKWFAECSWISNNGLVMLQKKTEPFYKDDKKWKKAPDKIPNYFTDIKADNFGWVGKQLVCHDYSFTLEKLTSSGGLTNRMQKFKL